MRPHAPPAPSLYPRIRQILESARTTVARSVNTTQVVANWLIGREIVDAEQLGHAAPATAIDYCSTLSTDFDATSGRATACPTSRTSAPSTSPIRDCSAP